MGMVLPLELSRVSFSNPGSQYASKRCKAGDIRAKSREVPRAVPTVGRYPVRVEIQPMYSDEEWGLLVGLPQSVIVAAASAEADGTRRTQAEWNAGMTALADGRDSASPLVREVATELVSRVGDPEDGDEPPVVEFSDPESGIADVIDRASRAGALLADKADNADAEAYRYWVVTIAEQVVGAAKSGDVLGIGGERISEPERLFRDSLATALEQSA
jgi:hypothetical protein